MSILLLIKLATILCFQSISSALVWECCQVYSDNFTLSSKRKKTKVKKIPLSRHPHHLHFSCVRYFKPDWFPHPAGGGGSLPATLTASIFSSLFFESWIILTGGECFHRAPAPAPGLKSANLYKHCVKLCSRANNQTQLLEQKSSPPCFPRFYSWWLVPSRRDVAGVQCPGQ